MLVELQGQIEGITFIKATGTSESTTRSCRSRIIIQAAVMIDKTRIIDSVLKKLKKLPVSHYMDLRTYKRNRSLIIAKMSEGDLLVIENGYFKERFRLKPEKLKRLLSTLVKREFPRSHKIRLYVMGRFTEEEAGNTKRKIL